VPIPSNKGDLSICRSFSRFSCSSARGGLLPLSATYMNVTARVGKFKRLFLTSQSVGSSVGEIHESPSGHTEFIKKGAYSGARGLPGEGRFPAGLEKQNLLSYNDPKAFSFSILRKGAKR
jgi:hypothetical protein